MPSVFTPTSRTVYAVFTEISIKKTPMFVKDIRKDDENWKTFCRFYTASAPEIWIPVTSNNYRSQLQPV
jgi:hypothetical protein